MALITIAGVLGLGMLVGILIAIGLSLLLVVLKAASPHTAVLGRLPDTDTYRDQLDIAEIESRFGGGTVYLQVDDAVTAALSRADEQQTESE